VNATIEIQPNAITPEGFAPVRVLRDDGQRLCELDLQYSVLAPFGQGNSCATDFLLLGAVVYALDKLVPRKTAMDCWTRELSVVLPVSDAAVWNAAKQDLDACLSFLTGDLWSIQFASQVATPVPPLRRRHRQRGLVLGAEAVCLFSGGLDSLVGAIDWLESNNGLRLLLVGHHDGQIAGPYSDQRRLVERLIPEYGARIGHIFARVGHTDESVQDRELTLRGRSLLFIAMGIFVASALGSEIPLLIPENGTIALNIPLTPSRRGSCSTRTAHPYYLNLVGRVLARVGLTNSFVNPLESKTKGEVVTQCLNQQLIAQMARLSVSCAKRGHKVHFTHRDAAACGRCMPCIYRRAALHAAGWDDERYGDDICKGEVSIDADGEKSADLRACLAFLRENMDIHEISSMLMASGSLDVRRLPAYAAMVQRTMNEIRTLLRDKAIPEIKSLAGL